MQSEAKLSFPINSFFFLLKMNYNVPQGSEEAYRESELWKDFNIIEMGMGIASPFEEAGEHGSVYDLQGRRMVNAPCSMFNELSKGIYIQNGKKVAVK